MGKMYRIMEFLADRAELETEPMPAQPIVEIAGDHRVLVENHRGVSAYSAERILINVSFGTVHLWVWTTADPHDEGAIGHSRQD